MTKKEFLEKLNKRLSILSEEEKKDILNEYKDIIEEKVKHGTEEKKAVEEFGNFDELVKGILAAYKINPDCSKSTRTKEKAREMLETGEDLIKDGAKRLTEATDKLVKDIRDSNTDITLEMIFELILRGICALILMGILTIPFMILKHIGPPIFNFSGFPFKGVFSFGWNFIITCLYFLTCFFVVLLLFKEYIKRGHNQTNSSSLVDQNKEKSSVKNSYKEDRTYPKNVKKNPSNPFSSLVVILLKLFVIFVFIIPLCSMIIGLLIVLAILIFGLVEGVNLIGPILVILGGISFLIYIGTLLYNGLFHSTKIHIYPFLISFSLILVGSIFTIYFITGLEYINTVPTIKDKTRKYEYQIQNPLIIDSYHKNHDVIIDNSLIDGKVVIKVTYYDSYATFEKRETDISNETQAEKHVHFDPVGTLNGRKKLDLFLKDLKNNKIHNYAKLYDTTITIITNENTKDLVKFS